MGSNQAFWRYITSIGMRILMAGGSVGIGFTGVQRAGGQGHTRYCQ